MGHQDAYEEHRTSIGSPPSLPTLASKRIMQNLTESTPYKQTKADSAGGDKLRAIKADKYIRAKQKLTEVVATMQKLQMGFEEPETQPLAA